MRKSSLAMIVFWVALAIVIIVFLVIGMTGPRTNATSVRTAEAEAVSEPSGSTDTQPGGADMTTYVDTSIPISGIDTLDLKVSASEIRVHYSPNDEFRVVQTGKNLNDSWIIAASKDGSVIRVRPKENTVRFFDFGIRDSYIDLYIPADYRQDMDLTLSAGSLDIKEDFTFDDLELRVSAGELTSQKTLTANEAEVTVSAGNLELAKLHAIEYELRTSAGGLAIDELKGEGKISASAGEIDLARVEMTGGMEVKASAGEVNIALAGNPGLEYNIRASAGSIETYFAGSSDGPQAKMSGKVGEGPYHKLEVNASAGSVNITQTN